MPPETPGVTSSIDHIHIKVSTVGCVFGLVSIGDGKGENWSLLHGFIEEHD
jgi:hypothetical protein